MADQERWQLAGATVMFGHAAGGVSSIGNGEGFCVVGIVLFLLALADMRIRVARIFAIVVLGALGLFYFFLAVAVALGTGSVASVAVAVQCALMVHIVVVLARARSSTRRAP